MKFSVLGFFYCSLRYVEIRIFVIACKSMPIKEISCYFCVLQSPKL